MAVGLAAGFGCDGDGRSTTPTTVATPTPTPAPTATPTPSPSPTPTPAPAGSKCEKLAPGPVSRLTVAPRELQTDGVTVEMRVRARRNFDEVLCLPKSGSHRLDFNLNQKNADGEECCWEDDPSWAVEDPSGLVSSESSRHDHDFIWRLRIDPDGGTGTVTIQAELDGVESHPWQSGSGYRQEPLGIVVMSAAEIEEECQCVYLGNGIYEGDQCPK